MAVQPWDSVLDTAEWRTWIAEGRHFGTLSVNGLPGQAPLAVPNHLTRDGDTPLLPSPPAPGATLSGKRSRRPGRHARRPRPLPRGAGSPSATARILRPVPDRAGPSPR
ncbi:hypothetical protein SNE510_73230 [Streptomyces sp. NE5-10]|nr:hypothetical protein SNE510_73230 [Streptomyces sp. NE5-10]